MSFSHLTLPTRDVERMASFLETIFGYTRGKVPLNTPMASRWLDIGRGQQFHIIYIEDFEVSRFESEFGRHIAVFYPVAGFPALRARLADLGAEILEELRAVPFERLFFREPVNGYVFEVIDDARATAGLG